MRLKKMTSKIKLIPCGVSRCEGTHSYRELLPEFEKLKKKYDEKIRDAENFKKILEDKELNEKSENKYANEIIAKNVELNNISQMRKKEIENLTEDLTVIRIELSETKKLLEKKTNEILEVKSRYELDEEIINLKKQIKDIENEIDKLLLERNRLQKMNEEIKEEILHNEKIYNKRAGELDEIFEKIKEITNPRFKAERKKSKYYEKEKTWKSYVLGKRWDK